MSALRPLVRSPRHDPQRLASAYALGAGEDRGSIDVGKRGDLTVLSVAHPEELFLAAGQNVVSAVVIGGRVALPAADPPDPSHR